MSLLSVQNLRFTWTRRESDLLCIPSFSLAEGERVFIHGASGSGKTTFLNLISGVLLPQSGVITLAGQDLTTMSGRARDKLRGDSLGFIFQMFNLLPYFTALENVIIPCTFSACKRRRVLDTGDSVATVAISLLRALQLDCATEQVMRLSVGQQQRVAAARALIGAPLLIIADEPTSALDTDVRGRFLRLLFAQCDKYDTALLFVSHDQSLGCDFDRVIPLASISSGVS